MILLRSLKQGYHWLSIEFEVFKMIEVVRVILCDEAVPHFLGPQVGSIGIIGLWLQTNPKSDYHLAHLPQNSQGPKLASKLRFKQGKRIP